MDPSILARAPPSIPAVEPVEAKELLDADKAILVDVREPNELVQARIQGALHIPLMQVIDRAAEIPQDKTVILLCHSGARSFHAGRALAAIGYLDVLNLAGGIVAWYHAGLPIEQG